MQSRGSQLQQGSLIGGYRIDELISRGGMGMVYRVTHIALNRVYALKVLAPELAHDEHYRDRFKREIRLAASLHHPNVVAIHYAGEHEGSLFVVMDYIDGNDLREMLVKTGALEPHHAVDLLTQITSALDAAHEKGLVHRDVKPANVLISNESGEEHAYLTDFGLAKRSDVVTALTATGLIAGTVDYMSPEQITGGITDARTDIYALGCVFYEMLTGNVPYTRDNSMAVLFAHVHEAPPPLAGSLANFYPTFQPVIETAMAKSPADRYLSAGDFARDATAALVGMRSQSTPMSVATGEAKLTDPSEVTPPRSNPISEIIAPVSRPGADVTLPDAVQPTRITRRTDLTAVPSAPLTEDPSPPAGAPQREPKRSSRRYLWPAVALLLLIAAAIAVVAVSGSGSSSPSPAQSGQRFTATAQPVPDNRVTGSGTATILLQGNAATVTVNTRGLLNGSPHLMHIHAGGIGQCPPASAARLHNGHLAISTSNGIQYYGPTQVSLTEFGSTSGAVPNNIDLNRYPASGTIGYARTVSASSTLARLIRQGNAVIVVHGIDYNHNGIYDFGALGVSDLDKTLPGEATAPALCGTVKPAPSGSQQTAQATTYIAALAPYAAVASARISNPLAVRAANELLLLCHVAALSAPARAAPSPPGTASISTA